MLYNSYKMAYLQFSTILAPLFNLYRLQYKDKIFNKYGKNFIAA